MDFKDFVLYFTSAGFLFYLTVDTFWLMYWIPQQKIPLDSFDAMMEGEYITDDDISLDEIDAEIAKLESWQLQSNENPEDWSNVLRYGDKIEF